MCTHMTMHTHVHRMTYNAILLLRYIPQRTENQSQASPCTGIFVTDYSRAKMVINIWMDKRIVVQLYPGMLFSHKNEGYIGTCYHVSAPWRDDTERSQTQRIYIYILFTWNIQDKLIHMHRMQIDSCQGLEIRSKGKFHIEYRVLFQNHGSFLELIGVTVAQLICRTHSGIIHFNIPF